MSATTLVTELAPWSSLVQRFGRCNRYGEANDARIFWLDVALDNEQAAPYAPEDLGPARALLTELDDVGPQRLRTVNVPAREVVRPVLRRKDLLDLFDTTADLSGNDLDVAPYIRDGDDTDVQIFWRAFDGEPGADLAAPDRAELCAVSITAARTFAQKQDLWRWDTLLGCWQGVDRFLIRPGQVMLAECRVGGYSDDVGWLPRSKTTVTPVPSSQPPIARMDGDPDTCTGTWVTLAEHLEDTAREARALSASLSLPAEFSDAIVTAANWHDVGKAHPAFQNALREPRDGELWAKSDRPTFQVKYHMDDGSPRPGFRHELASALAWMQSRESHPQCGLIAYLIAAHHGKVRLSIRSMPNERSPDGDRLFARGVWDGDTLPPINGFLDEPVSLRLGPMRLGEHSWLSRVLSLRDDPAVGPFRLAFLEALVRVADWRASRLAQMREPAHA